MQPKLHYAMAIYAIKTMDSLPRKHVCRLRRPIAFENISRLHSQIQHRSQPLVAEGAGGQLRQFVLLPLLFLLLSIVA